MFWKNVAWSWADNDDADDDVGYLLAADLRRTPDSAPDMELKQVNSSSAVLKELTSRSLDPPNTNHSSYTNTSQLQGTRDSSSHQQPTVSLPHSTSPITQTLTCSGF